MLPKQTEKGARSAIRHFAVPRRGNIIAAGEFKRVIHIWDLSTYTHLRTFDAKFDFGGTRLAISDDGSVLFAGAYYRHGITAYSVSDGKERWRRSDLKQVQQIGLSCCGGRLLCCFERSSAQSLDVRTGESAEALKDTDRIWESRFSHARLVASRKREIFIVNPIRKRIEPQAETTAIIAAAFSPTSVCLSESGGPVRCIDLSTSRELWRHDPPAGTHFLKLGYVEHLQSFFGVSWPYAHGGDHVLHRFSDDGSTTDLVALNQAWTSAFCIGGSKLVDAGGDVIDVETGKITAKLAFPQWVPLDRSKP